MNSDKENADPVSDRQETGTSQMSETPRAPVVEDFKLLKAISRGAFGKVFLGCKKQKPDKLYAIKVMKKSDLINKNLIAQATTERDALAMIHSPFVVEIYYSLQTQYNIFLVMEYLAGGDVKSLLAVCGYLEEDMAVMYMAEVTLALEHLHHKGIIHRDLKPDNMLIAGNGHIKLTDFGLSKVSLDVNTTPCSANKMTPLSLVDQFRTPGQIMSLRSCLTFSASKNSNSNNNNKNSNKLDDAAAAALRDSNSKTTCTHKVLLSSPLPPSSSLWGSTVSRASSPHPLTTSFSSTSSSSSTFTTTTTTHSLPGSAELYHPTRFPYGLSVSRSQSQLDGSTPVASLTPTLEQQREGWRHSSTMDSCGSGSRSQHHHDSSSSSTSLLGAGDLSHIHPHPNHHPHHHLHQHSHSSLFSSGGDVFSSTRLLNHDEDLSGCDDQQPHTTPVSYRKGPRTIHRSLSARSLRSFREGSPPWALAEEERQQEEEEELWGLRSSSVNSSLESLPPLLPYHGTRLHSLPEESELGRPQGSREILSTKGRDSLSADSKGGLQDIKKPLPLDAQDSPKDLQVVPRDGKDSEISQELGLRGSEGLPKGVKDSSPKDTENALQDSKDSLPKDSTHAPQTSKDSVPEVMEDSHHQGSKESLLRDGENGLQDKHRGKENLADGFKFSASGVRPSAVQEPGCSVDSCNTQGGSFVDTLLRHRDSLSDTNQANPPVDRRGGSSVEKQQMDRRQAGSFVDRQQASPSPHGGVVSFLAKSEALSLKQGISRKRSYESLAMEMEDLISTTTDSPKRPNIPNKRPPNSSITDSPKQPHIPLKKPPNSSTGLTQEVLLLQLGTTSPYSRPPPSANPDCRDTHMIEHRVSTSPTFKPQGTSADPSCVSLGSLGHQWNPSSAGGFSALTSASSASSVCGCMDAQRENAGTSPLNHPGDCKSTEQQQQQPPPYILSVSQPQQETLTHKVALPQSLNEENNVSFLSVAEETEEEEEKEETKQPKLPENQAVFQFQSVDQQIAEKKPSSTVQGLFKEDPDGVSFLGETEERKVRDPDQPASDRDRHTLTKESGSGKEGGGSDGEAMDASVDDGSDGHGGGGGGVSSVQDSSLLSVAITADGGGGGGGGGSDGDVAVQDTSSEFAASTANAHKASDCLPRLKAVDFDTEHTIRHGGQSQSAGDWTSYSGLSTPDRQHSMGSALSGFRTPLRRPLSLCQFHCRTPMEGVRRGPEPKPQEQERILGTPDYLAPEILRQETHDVDCFHSGYGPGVDWWALGVCLFEMLTGLPPFNDETPELVFRNIMDRAIAWPPGEGELGADAVTAIDSLLTMNPHNRPGASDVKKMALFSSVDWDRLLETPPAFVPQLDDMMDTSYFDPKNTMQRLTISSVDM